jgi:hypothetical protein
MINTDKKTHRRGIPTRWVHVPTVAIRVPKVYADLIMLVAIALDRLAISETEIEDFVNSKLPKEN